MTDINFDQKKLGKGDTRGIDTEAKTSEERANSQIGGGQPKA